MTKIAVIGNAFDSVFNVPDNVKLSMNREVLKDVSNATYMDLPIEAGLNSKPIYRVTGLVGKSEYTQSQLEAIKRKQARKNKKEGR
jgi:hypothetical protein